MLNGMTTQHKQDCPKCFGSARCPECEFADSCRLIVRTEPDMDKPTDAQSYEAVEEWAPDLADYSHIPGESGDDDPDEEPGGDPAIPRQAVASILAYLLHLDDYTLGILAEIVGPEHGDRITAAKLARIRGCSRQRMHLKLIEIAERYPELRPLLKLSLLKLRKSRAVFAVNRRRPLKLAFVQTELFDA